MAGNPHPVFQEGVPVDKGLARIYLPLRLGNPDALRSLDGSTFWLCYIQTLLAFFYRDTSDTTSEDNGKTVIVDGNAGIWKIVSSGAGVAIGAAGPLADRDAFDDEDPGFTYFGTDTELLYVRLNDGGWSDGSSIKGPKGDPGDDSTVPGPANSLDIGTVEDGGEANASITGDAPNQILNLVLPKGPPGPAFEPDEVVPDLAGRDTFDSEAKNFAVLVEADSFNDDLPTLYFKLSAASADWSNGFTFVGGAGGGGDVTGPASSTDGHIVLFGGTTGRLIQDSGKAISDLATAAQAIPSGGTAGQILSKVNNVDYNVVWASPAAGAGPYYNVMSFGAVGDGSNDDTSAIQDAIGAAISAGGGVVYFPAASVSYKTSSQLLIDLSSYSTRFQSRLVLRGDGPGRSVIDNTTSTGPILKYLGKSDNIESYFTLDGIRLTGGHVSGSIGFQMILAAWPVFRNMVIEGFDTGFDNTDMEQAGFYDCEIRFNAKGMIFHGDDVATGANSMTFVNSCISNNSIFGIDATHANAFTFVGGSIQYNGTVGGGTGQYGIKLKDAVSAVATAPLISPAWYSKEMAVPATS
ncbi:glycosyl hydrolase family 28-related protein [Afipia carboxidovorans]|uniref:glycosyl hydrolase family 28-related protein n=1 Tax=Afipia carboxidovorans TaxID=40137 RepID=UPI0030863C5E|nr:hypothetical protein CRBSH125_21860 [Afipia carboxidovorans]